MTPTEIPAEVKARIEAEAYNKFLLPGDRHLWEQGAQWLFCEMVNAGHLFNAPYIFGPERTKKSQ